MALIKIDWNPGAAKIRQFGLILAGVSLALGGFWFQKGLVQRAMILAPLGALAGLLTAAWPDGFGKRLYKAWMSVAFVIGSIVSPLLLGILFYGVVTPMALVMKLIGRDALRLKRPEGDTYWSPLTTPEDKTYYERLF
jgi:hypothetical protein